MTHGVLVTAIKLRAMRANVQSVDQKSETQSVRCNGLTSCLSLFYVGTFANPLVDNGLVCAIRFDFW